MREKITCCNCYLLFIHVFVMHFAFLITFMRLNVFSLNWKMMYVTMVTVAILILTVHKMKYTAIVMVNMCYSQNI
jgi:hypothetical protein